MTIDIDQLFRLDGRTAIVTGGTRGIGRAVAEGFGRAGARLVVASRKEAAVAAAEAELTELGFDVVGVACHMGSLDDVRRLVDVTVERFGGVDVVFNNAANPLTQPVGAFTEEAFAKSVEVNIRGPVFLIQEALPHLEASEHASIVNVVSAGAWLFAAGTAMYSAAKSAMVSYTKSIAAELAGRGVRVNALAPGTVDTDMVRNTGPEMAELMAKASLLGRAASPEEMVGPALFLASDASSFVTGSVVHADGGLVTR